MKNIGKLTIVLVLLLVIALLASHVGYRFGVRKESARIDLFAFGSLTTSLSAMQSIRAQDYSDALRLLEMYTYSVANTLVDSDLYLENLVVQEFMREVADYRQRFAVPAREWSATEKMLEERLDQMGSGGARRGERLTSPDSRIE